MSDFERELGTALREQEQQLDTRTLARIATARRSALSTPRRGWAHRLFAPAIGAAVLASALGIAVLLPRPQGDAGSTMDASSLSGEEAELYRDLDFYMWLAESDMGRHG
jgi:hypothetical protein